MRAGDEEGSPRSPCAPRSSADPGAVLTSCEPTARRSGRRAALADGRTHRPRFGDVSSNRHWHSPSYDPVMRVRLVLLTSAFVAVSLVGCTRGEIRSSAATTSSTELTTVTSSTSSTTTVLVTTTTTEPLYGSERVVEAVGSSIRVRVTPDADEAEVRQIMDLLAAARSELGESGPITVFIYGAASEEVARTYARLAGRSLNDAARRFVESNRASATRGRVWLSVPNLQTQRGPPRSRTIFHEYFHTVQLQSGSVVPYWLLEGSATYFGIKAGGGFDSQRRVEYAEARKLSEPLASLERADTGDVRAYVLGFAASDYLVTLYGEEKVKVEMWKALGSTPRDWRDAFASTFGVSVEKFYSDFEHYRMTM